MPLHVPEQEVEARVAALKALDIMDTPPEAEFDELVEIAAAICQVPVGVVSLLDDRRQWFKSALGMALKETPIEHSFCQYTVASNDLLLVEDATKDERFKDSPLVVGEMHTRFYAGVPLSNPDGVTVGALCVTDTKPRQLTATQITALRVLARQVNARLELRARCQELQQALDQAEEAQRRLARSENMFRSFMGNGPFHAFVKSADGCYLYYNQSTAEYLGFPEGEFSVKRDVDFLPRVEVLRHRKHDRDILRSGKLSIREEDIVDRTGRKYHWRIYKFPCVSLDGKPAIGTILQDITVEVEQTRALECSRRELQEANELLQQLAQTDALTGLPNRRAFDERLTFEWSVACRQRQTMSVALLDIDHFKRRNDTYGHAAGDLVLQQLARLLRTGLREQDIFARYGGEEFALLLPDTNEKEAKIVVERLLQMLRQAPWDHEPVTASFGVASLGCASSPSSSPSDKSELLRFADAALYAAKRTGRNRLVFYDESLRDARLDVPVLDMANVVSCVM